MATKAELEAELETLRAKAGGVMRSASKRTSCTASVSEDGTLLVVVERDGRTVHSFSLGKEPGLVA